MVMPCAAEPLPTTSCLAVESKEPGELVPIPRPVEVRRICSVSFTPKRTGWFVVVKMARPFESVKSRLLMLESLERIRKKPPVVDVVPANSAPR